jgi:hypothetical protein
MPRREVIPMSKSKEVNRKVSEMSKEHADRFGAPSWRRAEAKRLRMESARMERLDFANKNVRHAGQHTDEGETLEWPEAQLGPSDIAENDFLDPHIDDQLNRAGSSQNGVPIMEEIAEMERNGTLRPFIEGEPIGRRQKFNRKPAPTLYTRNEIMEQERDAMLELRAKNDRNLAQLWRAL